MSSTQWQDPSLHGIALMLAGSHADDRGPEGSIILDDDVLLILNAAGAATQFTPPGPPGRTWTVILDTTQEDGSSTATASAGTALDVGPATALMVTSARLS